MHMENIIFRNLQHAAAKIVNFSKNFDDSVITCDEIIEEAKSISTIFN